MRFDARAQEVYLDHRARLPGKQHACDAAGVDRSTVTKYAKEHPAFAEAEADAIERFHDRLEAEAYRRGAEGWERPVFGKNGQIGVTREYSDRLLEAALKANIPAYREKAAAEINVAGGVLVVGGTPSADDWASKHGGGNGS